METIEYNFLVIGGNKSGKTSFINNLLDKKLKLDNNSGGISYSFLNLTYKNFKFLINIYETSCGFLDTIVEYIKDKKNIVIFFVYEINDNNLLKNIINNLNFVKQLKNHAKFENNDFFKDFYNINNIDNLKVINDVIPVFNIISKYDLFKRNSIENRKKYCKLLRSYSIIMGANLLTFSENDINISKKVKEIIYYSIYKHDILYSKLNDPEYFLKAFYIKFGSDKFENLGIKIAKDYENSLKNVFNDDFSYNDQLDYNNEKIIDFSDEKYKNEIIDKEIEEFNKKKIINYI